MTISEITTYVMALPVEDLRRLTATEIMGWKLCLDFGEPWWGVLPPGYKHTHDLKEQVSKWRPDIDRNQSRQVVLKVADAYGPDCIVDAMYDATKDHFYTIATADQESRAALIAHMIHTEENNNE